MLGLGLVEKSNENLYPSSVDEGKNEFPKRVFNVSKAVKHGQSNVKNEYAYEDKFGKVVSCSYGLVTFVG
jgi:hypothetical protein